MTNEEFTYWIEGYLTLTTEEILDNSQVKIIINHANLVRAIVGELDKDNSHFISILEAKIRQNTPIYLLDLKPDTGF